MGLVDDCCPTKQDVHLDCCDKDDHQFRIIDAEYCKDTPEFGCYKFGRPECCLKSSINCPKEKPGCEVGFPIIGESYCTYPPKYGCYENGWPKCCDTLSEDCPENRPNCELGKLFNTESYCGESADFRCHEKGYPSCCLTKNANCPNNVPGCNIGKVGCGEGDSLRSICKSNVKLSHSGMETNVFISNSFFIFTDFLIDSKPRKIQLILHARWKISIFFAT